MSEEHLVFGRVSITTMIKAQKELLDYLDEHMDPTVFAQLYNKATLGLLNEKDHIIDVMIRLNKLNEHRKFLKVVLPTIFKQVLRRALKYYGEVSRYREIPEYELKI